MNEPAAAEGWPAPRPDGSEVSIDEVATRQKVRPAASLDELEVDVWDSDEELDAFLASTRAFRDADLV